MLRDELSALLGEEDLVPDRPDVSARVSLELDPVGGFRTPEIHLRVRASVPDLEAATFEIAAEEAKVRCRVSKALAGTHITLDAALE